VLRPIKNPELILNTRCGNYELVYQMFPSGLARRAKPARNNSLIPQRPKRNEFIKVVLNYYNLIIRIERPYSHINKIDLNPFINNTSLYESAPKRVNAEVDCEWNLIAEVDCPESSRLRQQKRKLKTAPIFLKTPPLERAPRAHPNYILHPKTRPNPAPPARPQ
jgi:hypothetical protein